MIYGAILGDIVGSVYEKKSADNRMRAPILTNKSHFTDDSVLTIAVADAFISSIGKTDDELTAQLITDVKRYTRRYPDAGYGSKFKEWVFNNDDTPYKSTGNGSAMRVSIVGWICKDLDSVFHYATLSANITHNSKEGQDGACAIASAIWMIRNNITDEEIESYLKVAFDYDFSEKAKNVGMSHMCADTVPAAIWCYLNGNSFESVIRNAISLGGDTDTIAAMAGSLAEARYAIPSYMKTAAQNYLGTKLGAKAKELDEKQSTIINKW